MMKKSAATPVLVMALLLVLCFGLAGWLQPRFEALQKKRSQSVMSLLLGDGRRIFANHFFVKADAYFHSGFYPTIFDNQESFQTAHMAADAGAMKDKNQGEERDFMGEPRDLLEKFSRAFLPLKHTHLDEGGARGTNGEPETLGEAEGGGVREILPWLRISADLDPGRIETYTVTAYWLRTKMGKVDEAEQFLREGLRANPYNPALLFELGRIYEEDRKDDKRARNIWELGVKKLDEQASRTDQEDFILYQISLHLARLEEKNGNLAAAVSWLERVKPLSPNPDEIEKQLVEDRRKLSSPGPAGPNTNAPAGAGEGKGIN